MITSSHSYQQTLVSYVLPWKQVFDKIALMIYSKHTSHLHGTSKDFFDNFSLKATVYSDNRQNFQQKQKKKTKRLLYSSQANVTHQVLLTPKNP